MFNEEKGWNWDKGVDKTADRCTQINAAKVQSNFDIDTPELSEKNTPANNESYSEGSDSEISISPDTPFTPGSVSSSDAVRGSSSSGSSTDGELRHMRQLSDIYSITEEVEIEDELLP